MSQTHDPTYAFDDDLPLEPIPAGTNLLVAGSTLDGARDLAMRLLGCAESEGLLLLSTDLRGVDAIENFEAGGCRYDTSRMAVVDCLQDSTDDGARNIHAVTAPSDLTGIGIAFSSLYEDLYSAGIERVRTGLCTLDPLLMYTENVQPLYRFLHTVTGRIRTANGLGVSVIDPEAQEETTVRTLSQPFDAQVELRARDDGQTQLRVRGLDDQPDSWQDVDL
ncbi:MAG: hypothetical protein V5A41_05705 [Haloarculaceae archaeon]